MGEENLIMWDKFAQMKEGEASQMIPKSKLSPE